MTCVGSHSSGRSQGLNPGLCHPILPCTPRGLRRDAHPQPSHPQACPGRPGTTRVLAPDSGLYPLPRPQAHSVIGQQRAAAQLKAEQACGESCSWAQGTCGPGRDELLPGLGQ